MDDFLNIDELSGYLAIKKSTIYSMVEKREIPHYKIGRLVRFKKTEIDAWLAGLKCDIVNPQAEARKMLDRGMEGKGRTPKKNIAQATSLVYTPEYGRPDKIKDLGKEASDV